MEEKRVKEKKVRRKLKNGSAATTTSSPPRRSRSATSSKKKQGSSNLTSRNVSTGRSLSPSLRVDDDDDPKSSSQQTKNGRNKKQFLGSMDKILGLSDHSTDYDDDDDGDDFFKNLDAAFGPRGSGNKRQPKQRRKTKFVDNPHTKDTPYKTIQQSFNGAFQYYELNSSDIKYTEISKAIDEFKKNPHKYLALYYYVWMKAESVQNQQYTLIMREGTKKLNIKFESKADRTIWIHCKGTAGVTDDSYQQILEDEPPAPAPPPKPTPKPKTKKPSTPPPHEPEPTPGPAPAPEPSGSFYKKPEPLSEEEKMEQQAAAQEKGEKARNRRLELDEKRRQQALERSANNAGGGHTVQRIPKRSAILARGGPEADEYNAMIREEKLALWQQKIGDQWEILVDRTFDGVSTAETTNEVTKTFHSVDAAIEDFMEDPDKYVALFFPVHHIKEPNGKKIEVTHVLRAGTTNYKPLGVRQGDGGHYALFQHIYHRLPPLKDDLLPRIFRDDFTMGLQFKGKKLHSKKKQKRKPLLPGRGMGLGDSATMTFIGDCAEPNDIFQGTSVGNCWLLSAIACLADFDFAIRRLFRKTPKPKLEDRPTDAPNQYIVTLWDLTTWQEVKIMVDEQLPIRSDDSGFLLGARPSKEGKMWVPYLEKAIAQHCGGYEKLIGGNCTNAWPMLTGSRNQYTLMQNVLTKKYKCTSRFNTIKQEWSHHANSPHEYEQTTWEVEWPTSGGGGARGLQIDQDELYLKIVAWDLNNYLIGASTDGFSDKNKTDGLVDNHAYSIIDTRPNICDTGIDLLLIRNPWGEGGELKSAKFGRNGSGWKKYSKIKEELKPSTEDNGVCWVTKEEFFKHFPSIYLCAFNTARLKEADYVNDLNDDFARHAAPTAETYVEEEKKEAEMSDASDDSSISISLSDSDDDVSISDSDDDTRMKRRTKRISLAPRAARASKKDGTTTASNNATKTSEHIGGRANQVDDMKKKLGAGKKSNVKPARCNSSGGQIELMKQKIEEDKKNKSKLPPKRSISTGGMNKVALMKLKFQGGK